MSRTEGSAAVRLRGRGARRVRSGHPWIFRDDVESAGGASHGDTVRVEGAGGEPLGFAFWSATSKIAVRLVSGADSLPDAGFWRARIADAVAHRDRLALDRNAVRLVFGEADGIPGLVADLYGAHLVVQVLTRGAERHLELFLDALADHRPISSVLARNDPSVRSLEGLPREVKQLRGVTPERIEMTAGGVRLLVDPWRGQKTGAFLDQSENRLAAKRWSRGRVLDAFAYDGSFAVHVAPYAEQVVVLDASRDALARARENVDRNALSNVALVEGNAFEELRARERAGERFDLVLLDPPAFAKRRDDLAAALRGYREINLRALKLLAPGGVLITSSCSYNLGEAEFYDVLAAAAADAGVRCRLVERRIQAQDHPVRLGFPGIALSEMRGARPVMRGLPLVVAALAVAVASSSAPARDEPETGSRVQRWLEERLSTAIGGRVQFKTFSWSATELSAAFTGFTLSVPSPGAEPLTATAAKGRIRMSWSAVAGVLGGRVRIAEIVLEEPQFSASAATLEGMARRPARGQLDVEIERLVIHSGRLRYTDARDGLDVELTDLSYDGAWDAYQRSLAGPMSVAGGIVRPPIVNRLPFRAHGGLRASMRSLELIDLEVQGQDMTAALDGRLLLRGQVAFTAETQVRTDLATLSRFLDPGFPALHGAAQADLRIDKGGPGFTVLGQAAVSDARLGPLAARTASASIQMRPGALEIRALDAEAYGGRVTGEIDIALASPVRMKTRLAGHGADAAAILALASLRLPISARADGTFEVEGEPALPATWSGRARFDARPGPAAGGRIPAAASGEVAFSDGHARLTGMRADLASAQLNVAVDADLTEKPVGARVTLSGTTSDASATHAATLAFMRALEVEAPSLAKEPLSGTGTIAATIVTGGGRGLKLDLDIAEGRWSGERFDRARLALDYDGSHVAIENLDVTRDTESLVAQLRLDGAGEIDQISFRTVGIPVPSVLKRFGLELDVQGALDSELVASRSGGALDGTGRFVLREAMVFGERIDEASGPVDLSAGVLRIAPFSVRGPAVLASGTLDIVMETGAGHGTLERAEIVGADVALLTRAGLSVDGTIELSGPFGWTSQGPEGSLAVTGREVAVARASEASPRIALGTIAGALTLLPEEAHFDLREADSPTWTARGGLAWSRDAVVDAVVQLREAGFAIAVGDSGSAEVEVTTEMTVKGPLARPSDLLVEGELDRVVVRLGPHVLESQAPTALRFAAGRLTIASVVVRDSSTTLQAAIDFEPATAAVRIDAQGTVDLAILSAFAPGLRATGHAQFTARAEGSVDEPVLTGSLSVSGARARIPGFPQPLDEIVLDARLESSRAVIDRFEAQCGGGALRGIGWMELGRGGITSYEGSLDVERVALPVPDGFRGVYEGKLTVEGTAEIGRLSGRLNMLHGLYSQDIDVLSLLAASSREVLPDDESILPRSVLLDVAVVADGDVWMRNNLGQVETRVDLQIGGTAALPEITGRLELFEGGTFRFRDVEYRIESGTIELADPRTIRPLLALHGTTRVNDVDIDLTLEGPADKLRYELTSNPPLSEQDIIGLLLTGRPLDELTASGGGAGITGDVATSYFAGALTSRVSSRFGRALGLDRFQIDPLLVENGGDPTTRVTVGKRLGADVDFLYSTTFGATKDETYQVEWDVTRSLQLVAETRTAEGVGGDLRYRARFGGDAPETRSPRGEVSTSRVASVTVTGVPPTMTTRLVAESPVRAGRPYTRSLLYEGAEALRHELVEQGHIAARITSRAETDATAPGGTSVVYDVELGPRIAVRIEGSGWRDRRRQSRKLQRLWEGSLYSADLFEEGEEILLRDAQVRGYYAADVRHDVITAASDRKEVAYYVDRGEKVRVRAVHIVGAAGVPESRVRAQMLTRPGGFSFGRKVLDPVVLEDDVRAIRILYRNEGFLGVRIDGPILRLSADADEATVTLRITEGQRSRVGRVDTPTDLPVAADTLRVWSKLVPGHVFSPAALLEAEIAIRANLDRAGYPDAVVEASYELVDDLANVSIRIASGLYKRIGRVEIAGHRKTKDKILHREIGFAPGDPVSREVFRETQRKLYRLGIFRSVRVEEAPLEGGDPEDRVVTVRVEEAAPIGFSLGPGYNSETGARVSFSLSHDNLGGYDRSVALFGRWSEPEKRLQIVGREPRLFNRPQLTGLASFFWEEVEQTGFTIERRSTAFRAENKLNSRLSRFLRYNFQRVDVIPDPGITSEQIDDLLRQRLTNVRLGDVGIAGVRDTRDDAFLTTKGGHLSATFRLFAKPFVSDYTFGKLSLGGSIMRTFRDGSALSLTLRLGAAYPMGSTTTVPISERFFAGGESTVRGFRRDSLGPSYADLTGNPGLADVPVGGEGLFVVNEEWSVPIWRALRGVVFLDAGNVFLTLDDFDLRTLRESAGLGARIATPIGPFRIEYGWKLDRRPGESPGELHLAIGSVF